MSGRKEKNSSLALAVTGYLKRVMRDYDMLKYRINKERYENHGLCQRQFGRS